MLVSGSMASTQAGLHRSGVGVVALSILFTIVSLSNGNSDGDTLMTIQGIWHAFLPTWTYDRDLCAQWEGVTCNEKGDVTGLSLQNNELNSFLPMELSTLAYLTDLNLQNCSLWGGLPEEFGRLSRMQKLDLSHNLLTGRIPDTWQNMRNLQNLSLQYNFITNNLPSWILGHDNLKIVDLSSNQMFGFLTNLSENSLRVLNLQCNYFQVSSSSLLQNPRKYDGNCFMNGSSWVDLAADNCHPISFCDGFYKSIYRGCPPCPQNQNRLNESLCICQGMAVNNSPGGSNSQTVKILVSVLSIAGLLLCATLLLLYKCTRSKNTQENQRSVFTVKDNDESWMPPEGIRMFSIDELVKATGNFHKDHEIGSGGFGKVYVGILENGRKVAIKCSSESSRQGRSEFRNEVVLLSRLHHRNLVHLEGFCEHEETKILVYEYVTNGNLHDWLFKNTSGYYFEWRKRIEIAADVARGLEYLHSFADPPVIHRDVKPSNILLDDHFTAKLSDFGLSQSNPMLQTHLSIIPAGTAGYIDPQYFIRQHLTTASDVYAFGVVLLELITGQKAIDNSRMEEDNLIEWVKPRLHDGGIKSIIDLKIKNNYPEDVYYSLASLAIRCASFEKEDRPSMKEVVGMIEIFLGEKFDLSDKASISMNIISPKRGPKEAKGEFGNLKRV